MGRYEKMNPEEWRWYRLAWFSRRIERDVVTDCWIWTGSTDSGKTQRRGAVRGTYQGSAVHRWAWEQFEGPIPAGLTIDHLCRRPLCCNTGHMELVTGGENAARGIRYRLALATLYEEILKGVDNWSTV